MPSFAERLAALSNPAALADRATPEAPPAAAPPPPPPPAGPRTPPKPSEFFDTLTEGAKLYAPMAIPMIDAFRAGSAPSEDQKNMARALVAEADARKKNEAAYAAEMDRAEPGRPRAPMPAVAAAGIGGGGIANPDPGPSKWEKWRVGSTVRGAFDKADDLARDAIEGRARSASMQGQEEMEALGGIAGMQQERAARLAAAEKERSAELQSYRDQYDRMSADLANEKIDSGRLWRNMSTGDKALRTLGVALGSFVSGATGQKNDALEQHNLEIEREVADQVKNYDIKAKGADAKRGAFALAMDHFGDERKAEQAAYDALMDQSKTQIQRLAVQSGNVEVQSRAQDMIAQLEEQKAQRLNGMLGYMLGGGGGGGGATKLPDFAAGRAYKFGGKTYVAGDDKSAGEIRQGIDAVRDMKAAAARIEAARKQVGWSDHLLAKAGYDTPAMAALKSETGNYVFAVKQGLGPGLNSEGDFVRVEKSAGDGSAWSDSGMAGIKANVDRAEKALAAKIEGRDDEEVATGFVKNAKGVQERKAVPTGHTSSEAGGPKVPESFKAD